MAEHKRKFTAEWDRFNDDRFSYVDRYAAWLDVLSHPLSDHALRLIASALARGGLEPDETGAPRGEIPARPRIDPFVYLDEMTTFNGVRIGDKWRAEVLFVATKAWCGMDVAGYDLSLRYAALALLTHCDLDKFWKRSGIGMSQEEVRREIEGQILEIDSRQIRDWRRKRKTRV